MYTVYYHIEDCRLDQPTTVFHYRDDGVIKYTEKRDYYFSDGNSYFARSFNKYNCLMVVNIVRVVFSRKRSSN